MMPALLNAMSRLPKVSTVALTAAATWSSSVTSHWTARALRPWACQLIGESL